MSLEQHALAVTAHVTMDLIAFCRDDKNIGSCLVVACHMSLAQICLAAFYIDIFAHSEWL
jgi:hypothetical protein